MMYNLDFNQKKTINQEHILFKVCDKMRVK